MQNLQQERALAAQGQLRGGSDVGCDQMVAADSVMTPNVIFAADTGGGGGSLGGLGRLGGLGGCRWLHQYAIRKAGSQQLVRQLQQRRQRNSR